MQDRQVKTKEALLVLAWTFLAASAFWFIICYSFERSVLIHSITVGVVIFAVMLPLAGWLATTVE